MDPWGASASLSQQWRVLLVGEGRWSSKEDQGRQGMFRISNLRQDPVPKVQPEGTLLRFNISKMAGVCLRRPIGDWRTYWEREEVTNIYLPLAI